MRISRADPDDPSGKRRRHFEISIDSPFNVLNCRATQANTALPQYRGNDGPIPEQRQQMSCGCPDAQPLDPSVAGLSRPLTLIEDDIITPGGRRLRLDFPTMPRAAHLQAGTNHNTNSARPETSLGPVEHERPIHLLRHPSHNPPAFDADEAPPALPLQTPPPHYDIIVGTPSVDGMADYFARLAAYEGAESPLEDGGGPAPLATERPDSDSDTNTIGPEEADTTPPGTDTNPTTASSSQQPGSLTAEIDPFNNPLLTGAAGGPGDESTGAIPIPGDPDVDVDGVSSASDSADDEDDGGTARPHRRGRVNVANPRTPGGRLVPSRSLEIERPTLRLDMTGVLRRRGQGSKS
jgi:hypothetical protein